MTPSPLKPLSVPQVIEDSLPSDNIKVRCTNFLLVTTQAVAPLRIILKNNELKCTMDGLVIESISLLTLLEVGDVPPYEQLKPGDILLDFPGVWLALCEDWKGIYQHVLATPEGWYGELLLSRLLLKESTQSLCANALAVKHLLASRHPPYNHETYPELSNLWVAFCANVNDGMLSQMLAASRSIKAPLITEAEALLNFLLITHSMLRERQEGLESKHWDDYRATEVARDDGSAILTYSNHFLLASVLLMHLKPNSPVLKDVALSWPLYLLYPNAGELLLIRTLLSHCYQKEGVNFLVNNFEQIIPEHLLFLSEVLMDFEDFGLIDLVVNNNGEGMDRLPKGLRDNEDAMAEAIENNVRKTIVDENPVNPKYFDQMSTLLEELIKQRREN